MGSHSAYGILMHMRQARSSGFTIIEVLIVLAVTGLLFLSATALISGRTSQTEFDQSSRDFRQQIQNAITQVASGTYDNTTEGCMISGSSLSFTGTNQGQGTDNSCIFIGDILQFGLGSNQSGINTYVLGGQRIQANGSQVTGLSNALPTLVETGSNQPDVVPSSLEYGLHPYTNNGKSSMNYSTDGGGTYSPIGAFALVYSFAQYTSGNIKSGTQQINVVPIVGTSLGETTAQLKAAMKSTLRNGTSPDNSSGTQVTICAQGGGANQYALVTIGGGDSSGSGNNGQLSVTLTILGASNGKTCP